MTSLPILAVVTSDKNLWQTVMAPQIPAKNFSDIVVGSTPEEFSNASSITGTSSPIVIAVLGKSKHISEIIRDIASLGGVNKASGKRLQWVHSMSTGVDFLHLPTLTDVLDDVPVSNTRGVYSNPIAEHLVLSCLYFNRKVWRIQQQRRDRSWDRYASVELNTQSMGIVGYGDIASACAKAVRGFDMKVTGLRRSQVPEGTVDKHGVSVVSGEKALDELLANNDFILNMMPGTEDNYHMFNKEVFAKMKKGTVFINIGRGSTVDENALYDALVSGHLAGAAIDVFEVEPLPKESKLWTLPDDLLLMTPHNCDLTTSHFQNCAAYFSDLAEKFVVEGRIPPYLVDIRKGY